MLALEADLEVQSAPSRFRLKAVKFRNAVEKRLGLMGFLLGCPADFPDPHTENLLPRSEGNSSLLDDLGLSSNWALSFESLTAKDILVPSGDMYSGSTGAAILSAPSEDAALADNESYFGDDGVDSPAVASGSVAGVSFGGIGAGGWACGEGNSELRAEEDGADDVKIEVLEERQEVLPRFITVSTARCHLERVALREIGRAHV